MNGELWLGQDGTSELKPHRASSYLRHVLPVSFDPDATCPSYDAAVASIFARSKTSEGAELVDFWHQLAGYILQSSRKIALIVIFRGGGSNGKTKLAETLIRLLGQKLVAAMPVEDLDKSRFATGSLLGKQLFLDDDVKTGIKLPDGQLKRLSEAKTITGENKFGPAFNFTVRVVPLLLCNNPPSLADLSPGMQRRLVIVPFDRTFRGHEADKDLFPCIWATELSGVLNRSLEGLRKLAQHDWTFTEPVALADTKERWLLEANPVPAFIDECCEKTGTAYLEDLYRAFSVWVEEQGITWRQQRASFDRNLNHLGFKLAARGNRGKKIEGLRLKKPARP